MASEGDDSENEEDSEDEGDANNAYTASAAAESADDPMDREEAASVAGAIDDAYYKVCYFVLELYFASDKYFLYCTMYNCTLRIMFVVFPVYFIYNEYSIVYPLYNIYIRIICTLQVYIFVISNYCTTVNVVEWCMLLVNAQYGVYSNKPMLLTTKYMYCTFALQNILYQYYKYGNDAFI